MLRRKKNRSDDFTVNSMVIGWDKNNTNDDNGINNEGDGGVGSVGVVKKGTSTNSSNYSSATTHRRENSSSSLYASKDNHISMIATSGSSSTKSNDSSHFLTNNDNDNDNDNGNDLGGVQEIFQRAKDCIDVDVHRDRMRGSSSSTAAAYSKSSRTSNVQTKLVKGLSTMRKKNKNKGRGGDAHPEIVLLKPPKRGNGKTNTQMRQIFEKRGSSGMNTISRSSSSTFEHMRTLSNSKSKSSSNFSAAPSCDISTISGSESTPGNRLAFWRKRS